MYVTVTLFCQIFYTSPTLTQLFENKPFTYYSVSGIKLFHMSSPFWTNKLFSRYVWVYMGIIRYVRHPLIFFVLGAISWPQPYIKTFKKSCLSQSHHRFSFFNDIYDLAWRSDTSPNTGQSLGKPSWLLSVMQDN